MHGQNKKCVQKIWLKKIHVGTALERIRCEYDQERLH